MIASLKILFKPFIAEATFVQSTKMQSFWKTI